MNTKLKLLKSAIARIESDREFMAFTLKKYSELEHISESELLSNLNCSEDSYFKLALCKTPDVNAQDFTDRLKTISEYANVMYLDLNTVIKKVNSWLKFSEKASAAIAIAARDKKKTDDGNEK